MLIIHFDAFLMEKPLPIFNDFNYKFNHFK